MEKVRFYVGTAETYAALKEKDAYSFYYTIDDNKVYLGDILLSNTTLQTETVPVIDAITAAIQTNELLAFNFNKAEVVSNVTE